MCTLTLDPLVCAETAGSRPNEPSNAISIYAVTPKPTPTPVAIADTITPEVIDA